MQVSFVFHVGQIPKPPPGFCQAAELLDCTVRSVQPHSPWVPKFRLAWISMKYVPALSTAATGRVTVKVVPTTETGWLSALKISVLPPIPEPVAPPPQEGDATRAGRGWWPDR